MKCFIRKTMMPTVFLIAFGFIMSISCYEAKADVGNGATHSVNVRSTKLESNRIIKVPKKQSEREKLSRGSSSVSNRVVEYSYKFLGRPYVWAASGPSSFDCSGFTSYVYRKFGYSLPHYTGYQVQMGKSVSKSKLKTGDLVFFNTSGSNSHVGIYIGNGNFIHASSGKRKVIVSDLSQSYYKSRYSAARRIIK
ncbi:C40 family peptidase [Clostridium ganghwense]|uniref:C40 family peptidase n=1 Tax=Clostridium ganghwense TaxID=312089 RepID=A0ABT4CNW9_9CLOT|nr:C40 family peptidase [Clostridium ganghwense]MCY6370755.1 C40 family peptidase [Clostridium ganghwense]